MKNLLFSFLAFPFFLMGCNNSDNPVTTLSPTDVNNTVSSGTWRITYYWDTDHEETSNFTGYSFLFGPGNVLTATKTGSTVTGTWNTGTDDSKVKLFLVFASPANFAEISDDWHVIERTATRIKLQDVSGGNGGTDLLTFEKN
jgi:hypothetical protein